MQTNIINQVLSRLEEWGYTELGYKGFDYDGHHTGTFVFKIPEDRKVELEYVSELPKFGLRIRKTVLNFDPTYLDAICREIKQVSIEASMLNRIIHGRNV